MGDVSQMADGQRSSQTCCNSAFSALQILPPARPYPNYRRRFGVESAGCRIPSCQSPERGKATEAIVLIGFTAQTVQNVALAKSQTVTAKNRERCGPRSSRDGEAFCEIWSFERRLCCRTCVFEPVCTKAQVFHLPCQRPVQIEKAILTASSEGQSAQPRVG